MSTSIAIGPSLGRRLDIARAAGLPVLLTGTHGVGKSQYLEAWGVSASLAVHVLDLSLLEPTDLTGLPFLADGVTRFAPPGHLPTAAGGPALLILEELNRCDRSVRQPCLQLLTARRLNDYRLPDDCFIVACVNPHDAAYDVDELDPALASRFVRLTVKPDPDHWLDWARMADVYPGVLQFVRRHPSAFDKAPPRSWTQAAALVREAFRHGLEPNDLEDLLAGVLPAMAAKGLALELKGAIPTVDPTQLLEAPTKLLPRFRTWVETKRLDAIDLAFQDLRAHLRGRGCPHQAAPELVELIELAPADLALPMLEFLGAA